MNQYILLSNDDGMHAPCLMPMKQALSDFGTVFVVAPDRNKSGSSQSLTLSHPLYIDQVDHNVFSVQGTPADCVHLGITGLLPRKPSLVVSGINVGVNICDDVLYSGTIAAAFEASTCQVPAIAFSMESKKNDNMEAAIQYAKIIIELSLKNHMPSDVVLSVNIPNLPFNDIKGIKVTCLGKRKPSKPIQRYTTPRNLNCYWIGTPGEAIAEPGSDYAAISEGFVSVTPLHIDMTHRASFSRIEKVFHDYQ